MNEPQPDVTTPQAAPAAAPRELFDPYRDSRDIPWMDRSRDPGARARARLRVELDSFPVIEGRDPNGADLDAMVGRIVEEMTEVFRREWAADTINEIREQRAAEREGRAPDPSIGPQVGPDRRVFVARPEDLDWVFARLGREAKAGPIVEASWKRQARRPMPGRFPSPPPPPVPLPRPAPPQDAPRDAVGPAEVPSGPPAFPAEPPRAAPLPGFPADAPEAPALPPLIPPDIGAIGSTVIGGGFQIPADPAAPLPGFPIPDDNHPARIPVLLMAWAKGELGANGRRQLIWVEHEELVALDPRFGLADEIYREAGRRTTKPGGAVLGTEWHHIASKVLKEFWTRGKAKDVRAEVSYDQTGRDARYGDKGSVRVDLVWKRDDGTIVIVDLKTGGANLSADQIRRIVRNVGGGDSSRVMVYQWKP